jgi:predicted LPLAT superfamily acyltransferase
MAGYRPCAVLPTRDHVAKLPQLLAFFASAAIPAIVVDDGSRAETAAQIAAICASVRDSEYRRLSENRGKGYAIGVGIRRALERGFTHAIQIDADGQHDLAAVEPLLSLSKSNPAAIVSGLPVYDRTIPASRRFGRKLTTFWVAVNTLSATIKDAMCGLRVYPVATTARLIETCVHTTGMDFETEILVRAYWERVPIGFVPVNVTYPSDNFSNFDVVRDNVRLSRLHARLFFGMLWRIRSLLLLRPQVVTNDLRSTHWASLRERGGYLGLVILAAIYNVLGRRLCLVAMSPVVLYFFVTGREQRAASREYLTRLWRRGYLREKPTWSLSFRHFVSFAVAALDGLAAWSAHIPVPIADEESQLLLDATTVDRRGAFVLTGHIGSPEVIRAIASLHKFVGLNVLMHAEQAKMFNRMVARFSPNTPARAFPVTNVGPEVAIALSEAIGRGEWIVMTGDRVPVSETGRTVEVPFLGDNAALPQGPFILAALLKAPVYSMFCWREGGHYRVRFSKFAEKIELPRNDRVGAVRAYASSFAIVLETIVAEAPLQWFNFYHFWGAAPERGTTSRGAR